MYSLDTIAPLHQYSLMNRLTITLDDELYAMARAHAVKRQTSISMAIRDLLRRVAAPIPPNQPTHEREPAFSIDPLTLLPVVRSDGRKITMDLIQSAIDDEDARHLEMLGLSKDEIARTLKQ
jgi:hypothetical protein